MLRCLYHVVAIHFGAHLRELRGGGESDLCLCIARPELIRDLHLTTSLDPALIEAFVDSLTYGVGTKTPDPALQPLVPLSAGRVAIPCILFVSSHHERNLLSLQARIQAEAFDRLSILFEDEMTARLAARLRVKWPLLVTNKMIQLGADREELDLLLADPQGQTLLAVELRWMLPPGDPREVSHRKRACWQKIEQLKRKVLRLQAHLGAALRQAFNLTAAEDEIVTWQVYGVVVIEGFGGAKSLDDNFPVLTTTVFAAGAEAAASLRQLGQWARSLAWLPRQDVDFVEQPSEIRLDSVTVRHPGLVPLPGAINYLSRVTTSIDSFPK